MRGQNILRTFLFAVFFGIGVAALSGSMLCDDLLRYYRNKQLLRAAEVSLSRLKSLNVDYDVLLGQLEEDPNLIRRLGPAALGTEPEDENTAYPKVRARQLAAARKALTEDINRQFVEPVAPRWVIRCCRVPQRIILFFAGFFLVLISFIWFGPAERAGQEEAAHTADKAS